MLQIDLVTQTAPEMPETLQRVLRLRMEQATYCDAHGATLDGIADIASDAEVLNLALEAAADAGTFAGIQLLNDGLEEALDAALAEIDDDIGRWRFGVAFSMRSLLWQESPERIDANLREILYGFPEASSPPVHVPEDVAAAMEGLIELSGRELTPEEALAAIERADIVYLFITGERV